MVSVVLVMGSEGMSGVYVEDSLVDILIFEVDWKIKWVLKWCC
jgi:hypothetical protein